VEFQDGTLTKVGIDFSAGAGGIGQIPVGISSLGGKKGVLTPALAFPADEGKVFTALSANVAAGGVGWTTLTGPGGAIGTNAPLFDTYSAITTPNNTIGIDFSAIIGELPYGDGTAKQGALLAVPDGAGAVGKVLTYNGQLAGGIGWQTPATPVGGDIITIHSNAASSVVPSPTDKDEQLILVAGELDASWDRLPLPLGITLPEGSFPEYRFAYQGTDFYCIAYTGGGASGRAVDMFAYNPGTPLVPAQLVGTFVFFNAGGPDPDAYINVMCGGYDLYNPGTNFWAGTIYENYIIVGGKFNAVKDPASVGGYKALYNICVVYFDGTLPTPAWVFDNVLNIAAPTALSVRGYTNTSNEKNPAVAVNSIVAFPANALAGLAGNGGALLNPGFIVCGQFNCMICDQLAGNQSGLGNMSVFYVSGAGYPGFESVADVENHGFQASNGGVPQSPLTTAIGGIINKLVFDPAHTYFFVIGYDLDTLVVNGTNGAAHVAPVSANSNGFEYFYPVSLIFGGNAWARNLSTLISPPFDTNNSYDIQFSSAIAGGVHVIVIGVQSFICDVSNPIQFNYTQWGNAGGGTPISATFPLGLGGWFNSIVVNKTVATPLGNITGDFMIWLGGNKTQYVGYITTATGVVVQALDPVPTGVNMPAVIGDLNTSHYGIQFEAPATLRIAGGGDGEYIFDPNFHSTIEFINTQPTLFREPTGTAGLVKAVFATPFQSQSYIASASLQYWIQVGATNPQLSYSQLY
jgi:hypothetical protein